MPNTLKSDVEVLATFCSKFTVRNIKKDRPVFYQGEIPRSAFFVKSGVVKLYNITSGGEEKIVGYEADNGFLPIEWLFNRAPVALYYYDTFTDAQLYSVPRDDLIAEIKTNHKLATILLNRSISMYIGATMHLHALEQSRARDKLIHIFQYLALRFGVPTVGKSYKIQLRLTHQDIANLIGVTRETVSGEISKLTQSGILKSSNLHYVVDTDKALRVLGENDFNELKL